jgi:hypothetical protein
VDAGSLNQSREIAGHRVMKANKVRVKRAQPGGKCVGQERRLKTMVTTEPN